MPIFFVSVVELTPFLSISVGLGFGIPSLTQNNNRIQYIYLSFGCILNLILAAEISSEITNKVLPI